MIRVMVCPLGGCKLREDRDPGVQVSLAAHLAHCKFSTWFDGPMQEGGHVIFQGPTLVFNLVTNLVSKNGPGKQHLPRPSL